MTTRPRDSQQSKVYDADKDLRSTEASLSQIEAQLFVDSVTGSRWYGNRIEELTARRPDQGARRMKVQTFSGHTFMACTRGHGAREFHLGTVQMNRIELLHQLAHYLQPANTAWHGVEYTKLFLELVTRFAPDREQDVRKQFKDRKIKHRTRNMSPEAREAASQRMKARHREKVAADSVGIVDDLEALLRDLES